MPVRLKIAGVFMAFVLLIGSLLSLAQAKPPTQGPGGNNAPPIELLARTFVPQPGVDPALQNQVLAQATGRIHVLLQLDYIPTEQQRAALAAQSIELQEYVPQQAWIALVPAAGVATLTTRAGIRWVGPWNINDKLSPRVQAGEFAEWAVHNSGRVQVMVLLHADISLAEGETLAVAHEGIVAGSIDTPRALTVWIMPEKLPALAAEEGVLWIEEGTPPLTGTNDGVRSTLGVDSVQASGLTGSGVKLFVFDAGRVSNHLAFTGRLTYVDAAPIIEHATHVAGTAAGSGNGSPVGRNLKGMAPTASLYSAGYQQTGGTLLFWDNAGDIQTDYAAARKVHGVDLATNSIGSNTANNGYPCSREGDYGVSSSMIDGIVRGDNGVVGSPYVAIWANGNERSGLAGRCGSNFHTTAEPSCAKNPIHVGATNSDGNSMTDFSSWGPCDDGRLKPIVSGPGCESGLLSGGESFINSALPGNTYGGAGWCGTSMATPAVAGVVTLAIQQYRSTIGNPGARPSNALLKAWLIHTARDLGPDGPDYMYGYGEVEAVGVIDLVKSTANYRTDTVANGQTDTFTYQVPTGAKELKVSLAWDDKAAAAFAAIALVNNLNLEVQSPGGVATYYPFLLDPSNPEKPATATGANLRDNQEQVIVQNPVAGTWTIRVIGASVPQGPQAYALAYTHQASTTTCSETIVNGNFEPDTSNWTLSGATRVSSPGVPPAGGSWSLRLGNVDNANHNAFQAITIPLTAITANLSFNWYMTTNEGGSSGHGYDYFYAEVQNESGSILGVTDIRNDGWLGNSWQVSDNLDLSSYPGQTLRINFHAANDSGLSSAFYLDNVSLQVCEDSNTTIQKSYLPVIIKNN